MDERTASRCASAAALLFGVLVAVPEPAVSAPPVSARAEARPAEPAHPLEFETLGLGTMRGITIGPIESALHPNKGYGSPAFERALVEARRLGATWVSLTPFGRVANLESTGIAQSFEQPFEENRKAVRRAVRQAHAHGLRALIVPHLWVESGGWRGELAPGSDEAWERWSKSYRQFVRAWAEVARDADADMFAAGVELRSWVTTVRAPSFGDVIADIRSIYSGPLTYAANWDDAEETVIWGELDVIGVNGFFPLAARDGATYEELAAGGRSVAARVRRLSESWDKPVVFTEFGYTTRKDPAVRPWEWPDHMHGVVVDQAAQAEAYQALLAPLLEEPRFVGAFAWRVYADPDDLSQEAEWGFSPRGKLAELVLRDAFAAHWSSDGPRSTGHALGRSRAERVGIY
jgi:hypothetical protein